MEFIAILEILKTIGGAAGAIITLAGLWGLISKKPKQWLRNLIEEVVKNEKDQTFQMFEKIDAKLENDERISLCLLRHNITTIYIEYRDKRILPERMKENLCALYTQYKTLGGNSFVKSIFEEMMEWPTE